MLLYYVVMRLYSSSILGSCIMTLEHYINLLMYENMVILHAHISCILERLKLVCIIILFLQRGLNHTRLFGVSFFLLCVRGGGGYSHFTLAMPKILAFAAFVPLYTRCSKTLFDVLEQDELSQAFCEDAHNAGMFRALPSLNTAEESLMFLQPDALSEVLMTRSMFAYLCNILTTTMFISRKGFQVCAFSPTMRESKTPGLCVAKQQTANDGPPKFQTPR